MNRFTIRVYGLLINSGNEVLLSDELINGERIIKFPGGGLEFGESTLECLKREWKEETGTMISIIDHFYTTDFMQISAFNAKVQVISIYYLVKCDQSDEISLNEHSHQIKQESFRWKNLNLLTEKDVSFPIDQKVVEMLRNSYRSDI